MEYIVYPVLSEELYLLPDKAAYWPGRRMLIVADTHFGKSVHFQRSGLPVPSGTTQRDFERLDALLALFSVDRLLVLGDLFHSRENGEWRKLGEWLSGKPFVLELVKGNHDILPLSLYHDYGIRIYEKSFAEAPFWFAHNPPAEAEIPPGLFALSGHVHPAVTMTGKARQRLRLECFCFTSRQCILPAFGSFTGNEVLSRKDFQRVFVIAGSQVLEMP
jgi:uncharacterized protein